ncbi:MAG: hypothetical protein AAF517_20115 [Planctomycetota bacterium]
MKRFFLIFGVLFSLALLVGSTRGALLESWYIWRLDSTDAQVRDAAIDWLGEHGTSRAVRALLRLVPSRPEPQQNVQTTLPNSAGCWEEFLSKPELALVRLGALSVEPLLQRIHDSSRQGFHPRCSLSQDRDHLSVGACILAHIGAVAIDPVLACIERHDDHFCLVAALHVLEFAELDAAQFAEKAPAIEAALKARDKRGTPEDKDLIRWTVGMIDWRRREKDGMESLIAPLGNPPPRR